MVTSSLRAAAFTLLLLTAVEGSLWAQTATSGHNRARVSPDGPFLYWRDRRISYVLDSQGCPDTDIDQTRAAVVRAFNAWEGHACSDIFFDFAGVVEEPLPGHRYDELTDAPDQQNAVIWLEEWPWGAERLAQTRIIWNERTGEILDVDILLNGRDYYWTTSSGLNVTDIENVLAHEIGHLLGFAHTTDPDATMYDAFIDGETMKRDLGETDIAGLCAVYPAGAPTPDVPVIPSDDPELASSSCAVASPAGAGNGSALLLLWASVVARALRRRGGLG